MSKHQTMPEGDIATETYRGPSARVAAAGQGFLDHFIYAFAGLTVAGALAFIFHKPAASIVTAARDLGTRLKAWTPEGGGVINRGKDTLADWVGGALHVAFGNTKVAQSIESLIVPGHIEAERLANMAHDKRQGFGNALLSHTIGMLPWVGNRFKEALRNANERWSMAITFGGAAGAVGYVAGWVKALIEGAKHGNAGKHQFERAQAEIKQLREQNTELTAKAKDHPPREAAKEQAEDAAAAPAKKDDKHHHSAHSSHAQHGEKNHGPSERLHTTHAEHHGTLAAEHSRTH